MVGDSDDVLQQARERAIGEMGAAEFVDAVAVASNFERNARVADATGIPLDSRVEFLSSKLREELRINDFTAAAYTPPPGVVRRLISPVLRPVLGRVLRFVGSRVTPRRNAIHGSRN
jgi:hypothetical protein